MLKLVVDNYCFYYFFSKFFLAIKGESLTIKPINESTLYDMSYFTNIKYSMKHSLLFFCCQVQFCLAPSLPLIFLSLANRKSLFPVSGSPCNCFDSHLLSLQCPDLTGKRRLIEEKQNNTELQSVPEYDLSPPGGNFVAYLSV